jgi:hypothetical protein
VQFAPYWSYPGNAADPAAEHFGAATVNQRKTAVFKICAAVPFLRRACTARST